MLNLGAPFSRAQQGGNRGDEVNVSLKDMPAPSNRPMVKVYFIGYKTMRPITRTETQKKGKEMVRVEVVSGYTPPICNISGRVITMPPIGEYIEVTDIIANELAYRLMWQEKDKPPIPGVTLDPVVASAVKAAYEGGNIGDLDIRTMVAEAALTNVSEDALIRELTKRGLTVSASPASGNEDGQ